MNEHRDFGDEHVDRQEDSFYDPDNWKLTGFLDAMKVIEITEFPVEDRIFDEDGS